MLEQETHMTENFYQVLNAPGHSLMNVSNHTNKKHKDFTIVLRGTEKLVGYQYNWEKS